MKVGKGVIYTHTLSFSNPIFKERLGLSNSDDDGFVYVP